MSPFDGFNLLQDTLKRVTSDGLKFSRKKQYFTLNSETQSNTNTLALRSLCFSSITSGKILRLSLKFYS